ncbi:MAG: hypothetical protein LUQ22_07525 [Methanotrichaceae archaeon]|nr:hypothetical protein [Methanotrichaceae archaeon]
MKKMKEEMKEILAEGLMEWWKDLPEDQKKAITKAEMAARVKIAQAKLDFLKDVQKILA